MDNELTRRAFVAAALGGGLAGVAAFSDQAFLDQFAPLSGSAWEAATRDPGGTVDSPYGEATVRYDDHHVPHVTGENEDALYYAVGYAQGADRLFQMDIQRRVMRGEVSAVVGERGLDSDRFNRQMAFVDAAEATWEATQETRAGDLAAAFADGVNRAIERNPLPVEFQLLEYEPDRWTPVDTLLAEKQISWGLTGSFRTLRLAKVREALGDDAVEELFPARLDHDAPILRDADGGPADGAAAAAATAATRQSDHGVSTGLASWASSFEWPDGIGSNSWVVGGDHTESGSPVVCNDPHLRLAAPPTWYEMNLDAGDYAVRGVTFPGVPFVVIGENQDGAWGFTNAGADVIDFYTYDWTGDGYRYRGEDRPFEERTETIPVADGPDETVTVRKTVHGPVIEREGSRIAVAWTGHSATRTTEAVYALNRARGMDDAIDALRSFDEPTQNFVYADRDGNTLYRVTGKVPIRQVDGERVRGDRIFDGSAGEAEWDGFTPFGESSWEGFVPFEEMPAVENPGYVGTANQRIVDGRPAFAEAYSPPFRGLRLYDRLDDALADGGTVDAAWCRDLQRDTFDGRAARIVPAVLAVRGRVGADYRDAVDDLMGWDYHMDRDSRAALVFRYVWRAFRRETFADAFADADLADGYWPNDWVLVTLPPDSEWFDGDRGAVLARAVEAGVDELRDAGHETYGDYNRTAIDHPFDQSFLNYPRYPTDGSPASLMNYRKEQDAGSSWRMVCPMAPDGESRAILPGGNDGDPFADAYDDQLRAWADGEYKSMSREVRGDPAIRFRGDDG